MTGLFTRRRDVASCPLTKQKHLGKYSNGKLRASTFLVNDGTLRSIADFTSVLINVKMLIKLKMLRYLVVLCAFLNNVVFLSLFWPENHLRRRRTLPESCKIKKTSVGQIPF